MPTNLNPFGSVKSQKITALPSSDITPNYLQQFKSAHSREIANWIKNNNVSKVDAFLLAVGDGGSKSPIGASLQRNAFSSLILGQTGYENRWQVAYSAGYANSANNSVVGTGNLSLTYFDGNIDFKRLTIDYANGNVKARNLDLRNGNIANCSKFHQIALGYSSESAFEDYSLYRHNIRTSHSNLVTSNSDNAIDFYVWDVTIDTPQQIGSRHAFRLNALGNEELISGFRIDGGVAYTAPTETVAGTDEKTKYAIAGKGVIYYNSVTKKYRFSEDGGFFKDFGSGGGTSIGQWNFTNLTSIYNQNRAFTTWDLSDGINANNYTYTMILSYDDKSKVYYGGTGEHDYRTNVQVRDYGTILNRWNTEYLYTNSFKPCVAVANGMTVGGVLNIEGSQPGVLVGGAHDLYDASVAGNSSSPYSAYMPRVKMFDRSIIWTGKPDVSSCANLGSQNFTAYFGSKFGENNNSVVFNSNSALFISTNEALDTSNPPNTMGYSRILLTAGNTANSNSIVMYDSYALNILKSVQYINIHPQTTSTDSTQLLISTNDIYVGESYNSGYTTSSFRVVSAHSSFESDSFQVNSHGVSGRFSLYAQTTGTVASFGILNLTSNTGACLTTKGGISIITNANSLPTSVVGSGIIEMAASNGIQSTIDFKSYEGSGGIDFNRVNSVISKVYDLLSGVSVVPEISLVMTPNDVYGSDSLNGSCEYQRVTTSGNATITLPTITATTIGKRYTFIRNNATAGTITFTAGSGQFIISSTASANTYATTSAKYYSVKLIAISATEWFIL